MTFGDILDLLFGSLSLGLGLSAIFFPRVFYWVDDRTNGYRPPDWAKKRWIYRTPEETPTDRTGFRIVVAVTGIFIGVMLIRSAFGS